MSWYNTVAADITRIPDFITYYEKELEIAKSELAITGKVEKHLTHLPGITQQRFNDLQTIEAVLNYINIEIRKVRKKYFQQYLEHYNRQLTSRDAEKYVDGEDEVIQYELLANQVALLRNQYLGITKGLESKNWMLGHIVKLHAVGLDDVRVS